MNREEFNNYLNKMCKNIEKKLEKDSEEFAFFYLFAESFNKICEEKDNLQNALNEIEKYFNRPEWEEDNLPPTSHCEAKEDILEIINKAKGDVKNERKS